MEQATMLVRELTKDSGLHICPDVANLLSGNLETCVDLAGGLL